MNRSLSLLISALPLAAVAQAAQTIRILDSETHAPVAIIYCMLLQDNDRRIGIELTDSNGTFVANFRNPSKKSTYQVDIETRGYLPFQQTVDPFAEAITLEITPDKNAVVERRGLTYSWGSGTSFGEYHPREPHALSDLPENIREKVEQHLIERLGTDFYARLSLTDGQIVDLDRLYEVEPDARNYRWTPYSYYLNFSFSDPDKGIGLHTAQIVLDRDGKVVEEIRLPAIAAHPEKAVLLAKSAAHAIAVANGFSESAVAELGYDRENDALTWEFIQIGLLPGHVTPGSKIVVGAHSGVVIAQCESGPRK